MKKIFLAGHKGMVGSAIYRALNKNSDLQLIVKDRNQLDLTNQTEVSRFFKKTKIDEVIIAAAKVGGIHANDSYPADFIYENLQIQNNLIHSSHKNNIQKLLFLGSTCIYPKYSDQPIKEEYLLGGTLEPTNEPYAVAKIAGIKMCESYNRQYNRDYRSVMPTNLYGPNDNFHPHNSHVLPALLNRIHKAKINNDQNVIIWGKGLARREFLYVDDMADACIFIHNLKFNSYKKHTNSMLSHINIGSGEDISIKDLAILICNIIGFSGDLIFDDSKPEGTLKKLSDTTKIKSLGWSHSISLKEGIKKTYEWYLNNHEV